MRGYVVAYIDFHSNELRQVFVPLDTGPKNHALLAGVNYLLSEDDRAKRSNFDWRSDEWLSKMSEYTVEEIIQRLNDCDSAASVLEVG